MAIGAPFRGRIAGIRAGDSQSGPLRRLWHHPDTEAPMARMEAAMAAVAVLD
jgi:hypothetical protein